MMQQVGLVAIGRNEGERLRRCLLSLLPQAGAIVYVDSGSTDDSVVFARSLGVTVVELDTSIPFTAARARNEGFARLLELHPDLQRVMFVDGDCEVAAGFIAAAMAELDRDPKVGQVCGRRRERYRNASIYNRLADMEWDGPAGDTTFTGGDVVVPVAVLRAMGGYNPALIAGEDPDLSIRVRQAGYRVLRIDREMTIHDAAMTRFGQWWRRAVRGGHAYAEVSWLHRHNPERPWWRETRSNWLGGLLLPVVALALAWPTWGISLAVLSLLYVFWMVRIARYRRRVHRDDRTDALLYGFFCVLAKFPMVQGQLAYWRARWTRRSNTLIEYKGACAPATR